jgi:hypothetical protein
MFGFAKASDVSLLRRAVGELSERAAEAEKELREIRAACFAALPVNYASMSAGDYAAYCWSRKVPKEYSAIEAVRLLLEHLDLTVNETEATPAVKVLESIPRPELPSDPPPTSKKRGRA